MKAKTIKKILSSKIGKWTDSITDEVVRKKAMDGVIVTGGSITSMLLQENVNDYDIYFKDMETAKVVSEYYVNLYNTLENPSVSPVVVCDDDGRVRIVIKSDGVVGESDSEHSNFEQLPEDNIEPDDINASEVIKEDKNKFAPVFMSSNAITLSDKIQLIIRFYGTPEEIHKNYDFTHCTCWWSSWDNHLELRADAMESMLARELRYQGSLYPLCSIIRTRKFIKRGWSINAGQCLKMCLQLNELDLNDIHVLEDQLTGVDAAYFSQVIAHIKDKNIEFDALYLCSVIDKIFN